MMDKVVLQQSRNHNNTKESEVDEWFQYKDDLLEKENMAEVQAAKAQVGGIRNIVKHRCYL